MEYMQLLQNVFMNSMETDKDIIILYAFIPQYDSAKT